MSVMNVLNIAASGMSAESIRLNSTASNISNADTVSSSSDSAYKPRYPVFEALRQEAMQDLAGETARGGVRVIDVIESKGNPRKEYQPNHPLSDEDGYIYSPDINVMGEMADMISASRAYQMDVELMNAAKQMLQRTLTLGE